ncbi:MAG: thiamine-phosphate kinase, partial [Woeseiaceae bacterium]|nr:thiamine-phosphate kinase [Woeseiaceae bacterium]
TTPGTDLVAVVDTLVDGVHYPASLGAADIGYRAVAVNLSDMAAMAARPRWMTLALTLPTADEAWLQEFASGLYEAAREFGVSLVGGDTTRGEQTVISVQLLGEVEPGRALTRGAARPGDRLYVSGTPGDAAAGLRLLSEGYGGDAEQALLDRFCRPTPRLTLGAALADTASACIDVSDGLADDIAKLARASGCAARIDVDALPLSTALRQVFPDAAADFALGGGDDYELCFAVPEAIEERISGIAAATGLRLTRIGRLASGEGVTVSGSGSATGTQPRGYDHFGDGR